MLPVPSSFVRGQLFGSNELQDVRIFAGNALLVGRPHNIVGRPHNTEHFRSVAFPEDLKGDHFYIQLVEKNGGEEYIGCINVDLIRKRMRRTEVVDLSLENDLTTHEWNLRDNVDRQVYGDWGSPGCGGPRRTSPPLDVSELAPSPVPEIAQNWLKRWDQVLVRSALADTPATPTPTIQELLSALEADNTEARGAARDQLSRLRDAGSYQAMTGSWNVSESSYRADLGRLVAWVSAIRQNREVAVRLAEALTADEIDYIVRLTGYPDKTVRFNATEITSWLLQSTGWSSGTQAARADTIIQVISGIFATPEGITFRKQGIDIDSSNMYYNTLIAIDDAKCALKVESRRQISDALTQFEEGYLQRETAPKTLALLQHVKSDLAKEC
jgi:hypothetical protein